jgi:hypothetical protein
MAIWPDGGAFNHFFPRILGNLMMVFARTVGNLTKFSMIAVGIDWYITLVKLYCSRLSLNERCFFHQWKDIVSLVKLYSSRFRFIRYLWNYGRKCFFHTCVLLKSTFWVKKVNVHYRSLEEMWIYLKAFSEQMTRIRKLKIENLLIIICI